MYLYYYPLYVNPRNSTKSTKMTWKNTNYIKNTNSSTLYNAKILILCTYNQIGNKLLYNIREGVFLTCDDNDGYY